MNFPENFLWGASNSGFQFEMGDPAGKNIDPNTDWYVWVHDSANKAKGFVSGDLPENGVNYWELYKKDHDIAKGLGLNAYRIGIEWSRIFPKSTSNIDVGVERAPDTNIRRVDVGDSDVEKLDKIANLDAVNHYRAIIEDLRAKNFKVFVCLNHFTLPLWVHNPLEVHRTNLRSGPKGWVDEETIVEFVKYAAYVAWKFGDIVDKWATFNEPMVVSETGYMMPQSGFPPALNNFRALRKAAKNLVIAHVHAYHAIKRMDTIKADEESLSAAEVGLIHNVIPVKPSQAENNADVRAAEFMSHMHNHFFMEAVCNGWLDENFNGLREKNEIKSYLGNSIDWLGINYYTRFVVKGKKSILAKLFAGIPAIPEMVPDYGFVCKPNAKSADGHQTSDYGWEIYPEGILEALKIMDAYKKPIYVTENGVADAQDTLRPEFILEHLKVLEKAITHEKIDVRGYFHWALTDNYEWTKGFSMKFGLCLVDLKTKLRNPRKSAEVYKRLIAGEQPNV
ncbi:MAG: beta-galactosidase BgaS [Candidatus Bathyarchaeia archaeon]